MTFCHKNFPLPIVSHYHGTRNWKRVTDEIWYPRAWVYHTLCFRFPTNRVFSVSNAANRTDLILWRKKGHSRGTSSVREESLTPVPSGATDGQDKILASNIIMLLVEAVKSSSSTSVSHKVTRTSCTWKDKIKWDKIRWDETTYKTTWEETKQDKMTWDEMKWNKTSWKCSIGH